MVALNHSQACGQGDRDGPSQVPLFDVEGPRYTKAGVAFISM